MTFLERVLANAELNPDAEAFRYRRWRGEVSSLARGELVSRAHAAAVRLGAAGVGADNVVALIVSEHACQPVLLLACMLIGARPAFLAPPTPKLDPARYASMIATLVERAECRLVVTSPPWIERLRAHLRAPLAVCDDISAPSATRVSVRQREVAFLQHSSGTTGLQKPIVVTQRALHAQLEHLSAVLGVDAGDRVVSWLPLYHDMGMVACFLLPMFAGVPVTQIPTFDWLREPRLLLDAAARDRASITYLPNFAFHHLAAQPRGDALRLEALRAVVNCSEPIDVRAFDALAAAHGVPEGAMAASYAMAENVFAVSHTLPGSSPTRLERDGRVFVSSGPLIDGTSLRVLDDGELAIRGDCRLAGEDGEYRTGDLGFVHGGEIFVTGRKSDVIIVHGRNIHPHDVESAAATDDVHPGRVVAVGAHSERLGTDRLVVIAERGGASRSTDDVIAARVRAAISITIDAPVDRVLVVGRDWIVKSTSGKPSRRACREKAIAERLIEKE